MICKHCKRPLIQVNGNWRSEDWLSFCGIGDAKHEPDVVPMVVESTPSGATPALVKDFKKTQKVKMVRKS